MAVGSSKAGNGNNLLSPGNTSEAQAADAEVNREREAGTGDQQEWNASKLGQSVHTETAALCKVILLILHCTHCSLGEVGSSSFCW